MDKTSTLRSPSPPRSNDEKTLSNANGMSRIDQFFNALIEREFQKKSDALIKIVVVAHIVPTLPPFLRALAKIGRVQCIIPKSSRKKKNNQATDYYISREYKDSYAVLRDNYKDIERFDDFFVEKNNSENCIKFLIEILELKLDERFLIIDIGGYFAPSLLQIYAHFKQAFLGVIEDTENGHQKYMKIIYNQWSQFLKSDADPFPFPVFSVARSELKKTEDYNVGKSIVESTDTILRCEAHTILERMKTVGVIGFGKIGRSIAEHLRQKHIANVIVYDKNELRQMEASSLGFKVTNRAFLLPNSDMIFGASGSKSIEGFDFYSLKDNVFIASCTSRDDEFDLSMIDKEREQQQREKYEANAPNINKYYLSSDGKEIRVHLLCNGDAVNFVYGAVNGPYIYSVQAGLILSTIEVIKGTPKRPIKNDSKSEVEPLELTLGQMKLIALDWLRYFEDFTYAPNDFVFNNESLIQQAISNERPKSIFYLQLAFHLRSACRDEAEFITTEPNSASPQEVFYFLFDLAKSKLSPSDEQYFNDLVKSFDKYRFNKGIGLSDRTNSLLIAADGRRICLSALNWLLNHNFFRIINMLCTDCLQFKQFTATEKDELSYLQAFSLYKLRANQYDIITSLSQIKGINNIPSLHEKYKCDETFKERCQNAILFELGSGSQPQPPK